MVFFTSLFEFLVTVQFDLILIFDDVFDLQYSLYVPVLYVF